MSEDFFTIKEEEIPLKLLYQPLHALHLEELNNIWPQNPSIPTAHSRRAWALARNLDPTKVHSWWWRRRKIAKKRRITIPRREYELEIGTPPIIPIEVLNSPTPNSSPVPAQSECLSSPAFRLSGTTVYVSSSPCAGPDEKCSLIPLRTGQNVSHVQEKRAYTRFSKRLAGARYISPETPSRTPSPLPIFPILYLANGDEGDAVLPELDASMLDGLNVPSSSEDADLNCDSSITREWYPSFLSPFDTFDMPGVSECAYTHIIGLSCPDPFEVSPTGPEDYLTNATHKNTSCSSTNRSRIWNEELLKLNVSAPWCIDCYRFSVDGSLLGACSWCWGQTAK